MKKTLFRDWKPSATSCFWGGAAFFACSTFACSTTLWASEGEQETRLDPLAWQTDLAIWTAIVFILLVAVLWKFAFGPILQALDKREKDELDKRASIEKASDEAQKTLEAYRQKLAESGEEARRMREEAKADAEKQANALVAEARKAIAEERERASKEIRAAEDLALNELATRGAELATNLAGKIIQEKLNPAEHAKLVERVVSDLAAK